MSKSIKSLKTQNIGRKIQIVPVNNEYNLDDESTIKYYENFISNKLHNDLMKELTDSVPWTHGVYIMFGKPVKTPRLLYCMHDDGFDVKKSYTVTDSMPWTDSMKKLKALVEKKTGKTYNYAQLNYYRNGNDYIGYHTDSEVREDDVIASVSLGASRNFAFRSVNYKKGEKDTHTIVLDKRSLIIMDENSAKNRWKHSLPKMVTDEVRINVTFRPK